jgi:S1-C subfamily serine protease
MSTLAHAERMHSPEKYSAVGRLEVYREVKGGLKGCSMGTAFSVTDKVAITARHVIAACKGKLKLSFLAGDGKRYPVVGYVLHPDRDIAAIEIGTKFDVQLNSYPESPNAYGDVISHLSAPKGVINTEGLGFFVTEVDVEYENDGKIKRQDMVFIKNINPGSSGGPVFNEEGQVVSIIVGQNKKTPTVGLVIPISYAYKLIDYIYNGSLYGE